MNHFRLLIGLLLVLTFGASVVMAETPDECAARLDIDIRVGTLAEATAWYERVMRECVQDEGAGEGILRLTLSEGQNLPVTDCRVFYHEARTRDDVVIIPRLFKGSAKIHWRHGMAGEWQQMQPGEIAIVTGGGTADQFKPYWLEGENPASGAGVHQFELRTRAGADKFEIMETWGGHYLVDIDC